MADACRRALGLQPSKRRLRLPVTMG